MSGIRELEDLMVAAHVTPHEVLELKQKVNEVIRQTNDNAEEIYRLGQEIKKLREELHGSNSKQ